MPAKKKKIKLKTSGLLPPEIEVRAPETGRKRPPPRKYIFTLIGINTERIDQKYGITVPSNITEEEPNPQVTTRIDDLIDSKKTPEIVSFIDDSKHLRKCNISMIDYVKLEQEINKRTMYNCFWDREPIPANVQPIGCPIRYVSDQAVKSYYSEISKDTYTIKENITPVKASKLEKQKDKRMSVIKRDYYLTDGAFCSFNCCMAFIQATPEPLYRDSKTLLLKLYNSMYSEKVDEIEPAHHWRKLIPYGGDMTIAQFRESLNKISYTNHGMYVDFPRVQSLGMLFEEKLRF